MRNMNIIRALALILLCGGFANAQTHVVSSAHETDQRATRRSRTVSASATPIDAARMAKLVTIYRDSYGVPHVFGRTDASTVFGFAYAQAEDYLWRVEENFIHALGRASELYGERRLDEDRLNPRPKKTLLTQHSKCWATVRRPLCGLRQLIPVVRDDELRRALTGVPSVAEFFAFEPV